MPSGGSGPRTVSLRELSGLPELNHQSAYVFTRKRREANHCLQMPGNSRPGALLAEVYIATHTSYIDAQSFEG